VNSLRPKVLIVDYQEEILISFEHLLEDEGFDTTTVWTGLDALKAVRGREFDLILLAEYLPDIDADGFMRELCDVPCVVMQSARTQSVETHRLRAAGAIEVVCKRSPTEVLKAVLAHRHRRLRANPSVKQ
jgi:DNA-binding response OmpR family regulator